MAAADGADPMADIRLHMIFYDEATPHLRPLTNSNFVCDFFRYHQSPYFALVVKYLRMVDQAAPIPNYDQQYQAVMRYFETTKCLHDYGKFSLTGAVSSAPNSKHLQMVTSVDDEAGCAS